MSSQNFSYSSVSYTSSSSANGTQTSGTRQAQSSYTDASGTTVRTAEQNLGGPVVQEERRYDGQGRELLNGAGVGSERRIEDVSEGQQERDRQYDERMEEEYAKREGGA